jgi:pimeloyl-ACP methyl ester carboxylesterase
MGDVRSVYRFLAPALVDAGERLGGEVMIVPEAGHYPQAEYPEIVGPAVARFLARVHE